MARYLATRMAFGASTLWVVSVVSFLLLRVAPGDAVTAAIAQSPGEGGLSQAQIAARRADLGLDRNFFVQYADWLGGMARGDAGRSAVSGEPVATELRPALLVTAELALLSLVLMGVAGVSAGLLAARYPFKFPDFAVRALALLALSTPAFWIGLLLIVAVANFWGVFLASRFVPLSEAPGANFIAFAPAAVLLALRPAAVLARVVRAETLSASLSQHYLFARASGASVARALVHHGFRTTVLPALTVAGAQAVFLLGGAVVVEQLFGLPGVGRALVTAVGARDYPTVQFLVLAFGAAAISINLVLDVLGARLDPRARIAP